MNSRCPRCRTLPPAPQLSLLPHGGQTSAWPCWSGCSSSASICKSCVGSGHRCRAPWEAAGLREHCVEKETLHAEQGKLAAWAALLWTSVTRCMSAETTEGLFAEPVYVPLGPASGLTPPLGLEMAKRKRGEGINSGEKRFRSKRSHGTTERSCRGVTTCFLSREKQRLAPALCFYQLRMGFVPSPGLPHQLGFCKRGINGLFLRHSPSDCRCQDARGKDLGVSAPTSRVQPNMCT